ncbi:MAG: twin-arginine translocase subunit TatC [Bacillota bacterium]
MEEKSMTIVEHLEELRKVVVVSIIAVLISTMAIFFLFRDLLFMAAIKPLADYGIQVVFIGPTEALFSKLKISIFAGLFVSLPVILWKIWSFVVPALHTNERRYVYLLVPTSLLLFLLGVSFAYFTVLQVATRFLLVIAAEGLEPMITVSKYISFLVSFLLPFGAVFELPLIVFFLTHIGIINHSFLARNRRYAILITFVLAALLTPPDVVSQTLLAGPMVILYEISIWVSRVAKPKPKLENSVAKETSSRD